MSVNVTLELIEGGPRTPELTASRGRRKAGPAADVIPVIAVASGKYAGPKRPAFTRRQPGASARGSRHPGYPWPCPSTPSRPTVPQRSAHHCHRHQRLDHATRPISDYL